ncbi:class F sortase [Micromonospora sagamiensis]|uniref:class F sortase n=1 Tax=Micromonospora sagamiensis TaxID=47875 RepID=UPI00186165BF|nr:class F sortase [Micromonospora sagamiensis]
MSTVRATPRPTVAVRELPSRRGDGRRWRVPLAVVLVLLGVFVTGVGLGRSAGRPWSVLAADAGPGRAATDPLPASRPVSLSVPAIRVTAPVAPVGLAPDGTIAVPPLERHQETGWYDGGPTPGESGPAIIVGHADTTSGPSVFHELRRLRPGDRIEVTRDDRSVAVFEVTSVERFDKNALPGDRVYGDHRSPVLRLITCGGRFVGGSVGYADNVIAFATLVGFRDS